MGQDRETTKNCDIPKALQYVKIGDEYAVESVFILQSSHIILFDGLIHVID